MTKEEAIEILQEEHNYCQEPYFVIKAIEKAIEALRGQPTGEPLTLEQLREMDGKPVWIERIGSDSSEDKEWALVFCNEKFCRTSNGNIALFGCYGIGWVAYAYPPAHIEREAWTAEWEEDGECDHKPYRVRDAEKWKKYKCSKCGYKAGRRTSQKYCPSCGRAMTPEAWAELEKRLRG